MPVASGSSCAHKRGGWQEHGQALEILPFKGYAACLHPCIPACPNAAYVVPPPHTLPCAVQLGPSA